MFKLWDLVIIDSNFKEVLVWGNLHSVLTYAQRGSFSGHGYETYFFWDHLYLFAKTYEFQWESTKQE